MTCNQCGSQSYGDLCADCRLDRVVADVDVDGDDYECPDCGGETSGEGVVCYRCRDSHQGVEDDSDDEDSEDDAGESGDGEEAVLVADGGEPRDAEPTERVERTDVGVSITVELTRGTGTRDQDKIKAKAKGETLEDARDDMDELKGELRALANECRDIQPDQDGEA